MNIKKTSLLAWLVCGALLAITLFNVGRSVWNSEAPGNLLKVAGDILNSLLPLGFTLVGALILSRQPRNVIGWLLMLPPLALLGDLFVRSQIQGVTAAPASPSVSLVVAVYLSNALWVLLVFPVLLIALLFPTGSPPSPRWRWVAGYAVGMVVFFAVIAAFATSFGVDPSTYGVSWSIPNPIGFLSQATIDAILFPWWLIALVMLTVLCVASLFVRFHRAAAAERDQIKWLLYAGSLFAAFYAPLLLVQGEFEGLAHDLFNLLFPLFLLAFPLAIGIVILRYRLWDIDILIRKTLVYSILTALLALIYFGGVVLLQQLTRSITGESSDVAIVVSTLAIAALFFPLRRRVQSAIDRRFYRRKYDAAKTLAAFGQMVRDETDLEQLTARLVEVVQETMQPTQVSVWLKATGDHQQQTVASHEPWGVK